MPKVADVASGKERTKEVGISRENSDRAFYKELVKVIEASDVIVEVLDARDPLGTRCADMEKMVLKLGPEKHIVLLLNKIDLVPREAVEKWLKYLREELPAVAFKCSTQQQRSNYGWKSASKSAKPNNLLQTSDCLGAETLIKLLKNYSRSYEIWFDQVRYKAASGITFDRLQVVEGRSTYSISRHGAYRFTSEITNLSLKDTYTQEELDVIRLEIFRFIQYNGAFEPSVVSLLGFDPFQLRFGVWSHHFFDILDGTNILLF